MGDFLAGGAEVAASGGGGARKPRTRPPDMRGWDSEGSSDGEGLPPIRTAVPSMRAAASDAKPLVLAVQTPPSSAGSGRSLQAGAFGRPHRHEAPPPSPARAGGGSAVKLGGWDSDSGSE